MQKACGHLNCSPQRGTFARQPASARIFKGKCQVRMFAEADRDTGGSPLKLCNCAIEPMALCFNL